ncbi:DMT family transporter [Paenibacillus caseinilyticus]|nr:DMT family transporter [Paenibacillus mucilaginosus]
MRHRPGGTGWIRRWGGGQPAAHAAMAAAVALWGVSFLVIKVTVSEVPPVTMAAIRFLMASLLLSVLLRRMEPGAKVERPDRRRMALAGLLGITVYFYCENKGMTLTTASNAALITAIIPILATGLDLALNRTRLSPVRSAGLLLAAAGTFLALTAGGQLASAPGHLLGNLFIACAMTAWVFYTLLNKALGSRYSGLLMTASQTRWGTLFLLPAALAEYRQWGMFSAGAWVNMAFLAVCCSAGCYFLYLYALQRLDVTVTTMYLNLVPVVGVVCGWLALGETVHPVQLAGGVLILAAIGIVQRSGREPAAGEEAGGGQGRPHTG